MRWFLSLVLLALFALAAACSRAPAPSTAGAVQEVATEDANTVVVYKSPT